MYASPYAKSLKITYIPCLNNFYTFLTLPMCLSNTKHAARPLLQECY